MRFKETRDRFLSQFTNMDGSKDMRYKINRKSVPLHEFQGEEKRDSLFNLEN